MPLYEYRCVDPKCRRINEYRRVLDRRNEPAPCLHCGGVARRIFSVPQNIVVAWGKPVDPETLRTTKEIWE